MSTGVIVALVVVVVVIALVVAFAMPRMRVKARERELGQRRERVATEHREEAEGRMKNADVAERKARMAEQEAQRERAEAQLQQERAELHEKGLADHELVADDERERFAGTSAVEDREGRMDSERDSSRYREEGREGGAPSRGTEIPPSARE